jgi:DNA-directed RNA polymerase I subunit RPA43
VKLQVADNSDGTHSLSSPSHISLLFSKTFNISIPLQHIPVDQLEFEHTAPGDDADLDSEDELDLNDSGVEEVGRWKRKSDGKLLGEGGKGVKFTVIG